MEPPDKPAKPLHTTLLICERLITDAEDKVVSAIRMVDVFSILNPPDIPPERRPVGMQLFFSARFPPDDKGQHSIEFLLERPDGEVISVGTGETDDPSTGRKYAEAPAGINLSVKLGVFPKQMGIHYFIVRLDGEQVQKASFTLRPKDEKASTPQPPQ